MRTDRSNAVLYPDRLFWSQERLLTGHERIFKGDALFGDSRELGEADHLETATTNVLR
jgi:hypothetical protein